MAFGRRALRGTTSQLRSHALGLPSAVAAHRRPLRSILEAQKVRHHAVLAEMETVLRRPREPPEPPEAQGLGGS